MKRRKFIEFLGAGTAGMALGAGSMQKSSLFRRAGVLPVQGIKPSAQDDLILARGLRSQMLIRWKDEISSEDYFGFNNDFTAFLPESDDRGILWVNHEYVDPIFVSNFRFDGRTREQVDIERYNVGGSILRVERNTRGKWRVVTDDPVNRRITGTTEIPFAWDSPILGSRTATGTLANCSGGVTPWGTILTCEENYDMFYGERDYVAGGIDRTRADLGWMDFYDNPPEHYGWIVEIDPRSGEARKLVAMGRCKHECATVVELPDGRLVVYSGDDEANQCLYKFVSDKPGDLSRGTLYVANIMQAKWTPLVWDDSKVLQAKFKDQTDVLVRLRDAARYLGGTPLDRPEDIEIDPITGDVFIALTNNATKGNYFGSILKISEEGGKYDALAFTSDTFLTGGEETGFACPDNLAFDQRGNLWFTSDISGTYMNKPPYESFKNNGLFIVLREGDQEGEVIQLASAPVGAELTGPWFTPDGKSLFLSVQHPGETSPSLDLLTSHWPDGGISVPRPAVVVISGELLEQVQQV